MLLDNSYYTSRSSIVDRQECPRLGFLSEDFDGQGYSLRARRVPLLSGIHEHNVLADILGHFSGLKPLDLEPGQDPVDASIKKVFATYSAEITDAGIVDLTDKDVQFTMQEQLTMLEGMTRGWVAYRLPHILETYSVVSIEDEWLWEMGPGIFIPVRRDALLRRKADDLAFILDYKGAPYVDDGWQRKHERSTQTMMYIEATEEQLGESIGGIFYEGLVRGQWRKDTAKGSPFYGRRIQQSVYCYGYQNTDGEIPLRQSRYTNRKGFQKFRVADEIAGGYMTMAEWLDLLREEGVLPELFITMDPVNPTPEFRGRLREQKVANITQYVQDLQLFNRLAAEKGLEHPDVERLLNIMAPMNEERCEKYGFDNRCPFYDLCPSPGGGLQAIREDQETFKQREPHHDTVAKLIPLKQVA